MHVYKAAAWFQANSFARLEVAASTRLLHAGDAGLLKGGLIDAEVPRGAVLCQPNPFSPCAAGSGQNLLEQV